ncbi:hypothetical protein SS50377_20959 [Spironucleus salmonicida]|uniref:Uncharacterized protein n=1 Tax=Spironucleus salmonicida TaxID=348837 RepID=V6LS72_9EUKA|nr:hypothetical protein SS50377_20959 [Spironucleus salmonicida]|eukprot:EST43629.1 Hypothetical protein SS50377_16672 [Spironucleus salmonicida]
MRAWKEQIKDYENTRNKVVQLAPMQKPYRPIQALTNPVTHQFYDQKVEQIVKTQQQKLDTAQMNIARDKQIRHQGEFNFVDDRSAYTKIRPQPVPKQVNYDFTQPHVRDNGYKPEIHVQRSIKQNESSLVRSTFKNFVDTTLPLFGGKTRGFPHQGCKKPYLQKYDDCTRFPLGYVGVE